MRRAAPVAVLLATACIPSEGPMMAPFQDCLGCHGGSGSDDARTWTVAGTWAKGAHVTITDANGKSFTLRGNAAGNFYTAESLAFPLVVSVDGRVMKRATDSAPMPVTYGGCNLCHHAEAVADLSLMAPGRDCLECHRPGGVAAGKAFSSAGTFRPGDAVTVGGRAFTANAAGNFYWYASTTPIAFPATARVNGSTMSPPPTYGGCNLCHGSGGAEGGDD